MKAKKKKEQGIEIKEKMQVQEIKIFFPDELKKGNYCNSVNISHTGEECMFDFLAVASQVGSVVARIFMSPSHTKRFSKKLTEVINGYEEVFGEIPEKIKEIK